MNSPSLLGAGCSAVEYLAAVATAAGAHLDNPVGCTDDVRVVLDDNDGVALIDKLAEHIEQDADVLEMQACGGFVEDVERASRVATGKLCGKLHALALSARKGIAWLPELDVAESHFLQDLYLVQDDGLVGKELDGLVDGHVEHVGYALAAEAHLERLAVVALAATLFARHKDVGQEVHLDGPVAVAATAFTASALHVEREAAGLVAPDACLRQFDEELAYVREDIRIGGGIGARRPSQGTLVHVDDLVDVLQSLEGVVGQGFGQRAVEVFAEDGEERLADEGALAASADAGDADELAERYLDIDVLEVVAASSAEKQPLPSPLQRRRR